MKQTNQPRYVIVALLVLFFVAAFWSCKDDDPTLAELREDKLAFLADSLRLSDSLSRINAAGAVNYAVTVVSGSTSTLYTNGTGPGRTEDTKAVVDGAIVTVSQFGKVQKDTTDASGTVVFNGFFRSAMNVTVEKEGFTTVSYIAAVSVQDQTRNNTINFVGNLIPLFETTGANTATISGRATIQTDLTNKTRELVPDGTTLRASIDASNTTFASKFLTTTLANLKAYTVSVSSTSGGTTTSSSGSYTILYVGEVLQASYSTGVVGSVTAGNYTVTVPAAIDGLPLIIEYSDVAADQRLFERSGVIPGDRTATYRTLFIPGVATLSPIPSGASVNIGFESFTSAATATAVISDNAGTIDRINVTNGGSGYNAASPPPVEITGGGGSGATATALVGANGRITGITLVNPGTGYTSDPLITIVSGGTSADASATLDLNQRKVFTVLITNQGSGYTSPPTVGFTGGGGTGAAATAQVANGRVVAVIVTAQGSAFTGVPTVTFTGGGGTGAAGTAFLGAPVQQVDIVAPGFGGVDYTSSPTVTFSPPEFSNGTTAQGQAVVDPASRNILGVLVTNPGSGYVAAPIVTIDGGSGATTQVFLTGGSLISADITGQGSGYTGAPLVRFTGGDGTGAAATAIMSNGKVIGLQITAGGTGYTSAPTIDLISGSGAIAYASITDGAISSITVSDGGADFTAAPRVNITTTPTTGIGGGATATAAISGGRISGVTVTAGGSGYLEGNIPGAGSEEAFSATKGTTLLTKPGLRYINDIHYGTGVRQPN